MDKSIRLTFLAHPDRYFTFISHRLSLVKLVGLRLYCCDFE